MRKGRHVDRSVLSWPACVSLALDYELSRDPPTQFFYFSVLYLKAWRSWGVGGCGPCATEQLEWMRTWRVS